MDGSRCVFLMLCFLFSMRVMAFPCYMTLVKDNCWTNYNLTVNVIDTSTEKNVITIVVPSGKSWTRSQFECHPEQTFMMMASFSPVFWDADVGKMFAAKRYWSLPEAVTEGTIAWNMNICYSDDFSGVPLPPEASGTCQCDYSTIPPVKENK
jgi:hypothetical protein